LYFLVIKPLRDLTLSLAKVIKPVGYS